jgi:hypothetical protein
MKKLKPPAEGYQYYRTATNIDEVQETVRYIEEYKNAGHFPYKDIADIVTVTTKQGFHIWVKKNSK